MQSLYDLLTPGEIYNYYDTPTVSFLSFSGGQTGIIAQPNTRRVALFIGTSNSQIWVAPVVTLTAGADSTVQQGIQVNLTNNWLQITYEQYGPLVSQVWTAATAVGIATVARVTVVEIVMLQSAFRDLQRETLKSQFRPGSGANGITRNTRAKSQSLWDMVFSACRQQGNGNKRSNGSSWPRY